VTAPTRPSPRRGVYEIPFWEHVERRELRVQRCAACGELRFPPGPACPECLSGDYEWSPLSGEGHVLAWTVFHRQYFPELPPPYTVVAVRTAEGPILVANYVNANGRRAACGDRVTLTYEDVAGEPDDWTIYQWQPAEERNDHGTDGRPAT
jgi:uncharacterized OB-fold protein